MSWYEDFSYFLQEIIRLKYPVSLQKLQEKASSSSSQFGLTVSTDQPIILLGLGTFLPHGENIFNDILVEAFVKEENQQKDMAFGTVNMTVKEQLHFAKPCIENKYGIRKIKNSEKDQPSCYLPPKPISSQRKFKRRCLGIHVLPVMFVQKAEILPGVAYRIGLRMRYEGTVENKSVETVWGGGGQNEARSSDDCGKVKFRFSKWRQEGIRSSVTCGQIPQLYYV